MDEGILFIEFITAPGGVTSVLENLLATFSDRKKVVFLDPYNSEFCQTLREEGVSILEYPIPTKNTALGWHIKYRRPYLIARYSLTYFAYAIRLAWYLRRNNFVCIYVSSKKGLIFSTLLGRMTGIPLIYHAHGFNSSKDIGRVYRCAMNKAAYVVAVSEDVKKKLRAAKVKNERIEVVYNGVDIKKINRMADEGPFNNTDGDKEDFRLLIGANLHFGKGIHIAIDSIRILKEKGTRCILTVAGDTPAGGDEAYKNRLSNDVERMNLKDNVIFIGRSMNIYREIKKSDAVVLPSIGGFESFGMIIAEAMALKKPAIGSRIGGIPEVIEEGATGFLCEPGSAEDLAEKVEVLAGNRKMREAMGKNAYERVTRMFNLEDQANSIYKIIEEVSCHEERKRC